MIEEVDRDVLLQVVRFEVRDSIELGVPFGFEFAEALLDPGEDSTTGVVVASGPWCQRATGVGSLETTKSTKEDLHPIPFS